MRRKRLTISAEWFIAWLRNPVPPGLVSEGIPPDARIVAAGWVMPGVIELAIESESFEEIPIGGEIPNMRPPTFSQEVR